MAVRRPAAAFKRSLLTRLGRSPFAPCPPYCDEESLELSAGEDSFQILTVRSSLAEASRLPSGLKATPMTMLPCPRSVNCSWPVVGSHTFTNLSHPAVANCLPTGLYDTRLTPASSGNLSILLPVAASHTETPSGPAEAMWVPSGL